MTPEVLAALPAVVDEFPLNDLDAVLLLEAIDADERAA